MTSPFQNRPVDLQAGVKSAAAECPSDAGLPPGDTVLPTGDTVLSPGDTVGKYVIRRMLGQGGMGVVYEAWDSLLERAVAVKVLCGKGPPDAEATQRFLREARTIAGLHDPNIVTVHEIDQHQGGYYLVLELVPCGSAQDRLRVVARLGWEEATRVIADACRGLVTAHAAGVVHRDVKPANLLIGVNGVAKLADFGMARSAQPRDGSITALGLIAGTPDYMSPEQCRGDPVDARTDIYSLGATYYTLLTGVVPFPREAAVEIMLAHCAGPVPDPRRRVADVPDGCAEIVRRAMAKDSSERHPTAQALLVELEAQLTAPSRRTATTLPAVPTRARRQVACLLALGLVAVIAASAAVLAVIAWLTNEPPIPKDPEKPVFVTREHLLQGPLDAGGTVEALAFSRDDHLLAWAASNKNAVCVLHVKTGQRFAAPHSHPVLCLALAPDGKTIAVGSSESRLRFWETGPDLAERAGLETPGGSVRAVAFSPDAKWVAAGIEPWKDSDITLRVWRLGTGEESLSLTHHMEAVDAVAFAPDGKTLATASRDGVIHLYRTSTWKILRTLRTEKGAAKVLAFSPGGETLAAAVTGGGSDVPTWIVATGERSFSLRGHPGEVAAVAFAPGGRRIATGAADGVRLWDAATGKQLDGPLQGGGLLRGLAYSNDGTVLATGASDRLLNIWHVERPP